MGLLTANETVTSQMSVDRINQNIQSVVQQGASLEQATAAVLGLVFQNALGYVTAMRVARPRDPTFRN